MAKMLSTMLSTGIILHCRRAVERLSLTRVAGPVDNPVDNSEDAIKTGRFLCRARARARPSQASQKPLAGVAKTRGAGLIVPNAAKTRPKTRAAL